jgi:hypothetical protein
MNEMHEFGTGLRKHLGHEEPREPVAPPAQQAEEEQKETVELSPIEQELEQRLAYLAAAEAALDQRERVLAEREENAEAALTLLAEEQARVESEKKRLTEIGPNGDVRELLRRRAAQNADLLWGSFEDALRSDDLELRLFAARTIVGELYSNDGSRPVEDAVDELARIRQRRTGG